MIILWSEGRAWSRLEEFRHCLDGEQDGEIVSMGTVYRVVNIWDYSLQEELPRHRLNSSHQLGPWIGTGSLPPGSSFPEMLKHRSRLVFRRQHGSTPRHQ